MSVGSNPTAVPASHRCRVSKSGPSDWDVACSDCAFGGILTDWYLAMGEARHHWGLFNAPQVIPILGYGESYNGETLPQDPARIRRWSALKRFARTT